MDSCDWSNGIRYHIFVTRSDTEFKPSLRYDYPLIPPNRASRPIRDERDDAMSIDQLETTNDYDQIW